MGQSTIVLGDIFIGKFDKLLGFGDKPEIYSARYSIRAFNGLFFPMPTGTMILAAAPGKIIEIGTGDTFDAGGFGKFVKIEHDGFFTKYGHLNDVVVNNGDSVIAGQLIGHSNRSGNTDAEGLFFGLQTAPIDKNNGYGGYINPEGENIVWDVKNITEPIVPHPEIVPPIQVDPRDYSIKSQALIDIQTIITFAQNNGYMPDLHLSTGENINAWIADILYKNQLRKSEIRSDNLVLSQDELEEHDPLLDLAQKHPLAKLKQNVIGFIWE